MCKSQCVKVPELGNLSERSVFMKSRTLMLFLSLLIFVLVPCVAESRISIMGGLTHETQVKAGEAYKGVIFIQNTGDEPQEVRVYQKDYLFFFDGRNIYGDPGKDPRSNAKWITFSPQRLTIPPQQRSQVNYSVKVPDERQLLGTYWSMIMVEEMGKGLSDEVKQEKDKVTMGIRVVVNYGIQMVTHIGDTGTHQLKFLNTQLIKRDGERSLQVDLENTGERWLRPLLLVDLHDEKGVYVGRFEGERFRIYPGTSVRYKVDLKALPKGTYKALVVADCGEDYVFGANYTLDVKK